MLLCFSRVMKVIHFLAIFLSSQLSCLLAAFRLSCVQNPARRIAFGVLIWLAKPSFQNDKQNDMGSSIALRHTDGLRPRPRHAFELYNVHRPI